MLHARKMLEDLRSTLEKESSFQSVVTIRTVDGMLDNLDDTIKDQTGMTTPELEAALKAKWSRATDLSHDVEPGLAPPGGYGKAPVYPATLDSVDSSGPSNYSAWDWLYKCACLSHTSYGDHETIRSTTGGNDGNLEIWNFESPVADLQGIGIVDAHPNHNYHSFITVALRGTDNWKNWMRDAICIYAKTEFLGEVHVGFLDGVLKFYGMVERYYKKHRLPIVITGHSLGGAMAQLLGLMMLHNNIPVQGIVTYGQPCAGSDKSYKDWLKILDKAVPGIHRYAVLQGRPFYLNCYHRSDLVPKLPSNFSKPWTQCGRRVKLSGDSYSLETHKDPFKEKIKRWKAWPVDSPNISRHSIDKYADKCGELWEKYNTGDVSR